MPPLKPVADVARIAANATLNGISTANIFHVRRTNGWTTTALQSVVTLVRTAYVARFIPLQDNGFVLGNVEGVDLSSETGAVAVAGGTTPGTFVGNALPNNSAICVSWVIDRHYRGGHPRTYFGGIAVASGADVSHTIPTAQLTSWRTAAEGFRTDINNAIAEGQNINLVSVHRYRAGVQLAVPLVSVITGSSVDDRLDSQRRRLGRDR